jgi:DNA repair exonuclease SbcCD ATPase subunit
MDETVSSIKLTVGELYALSTQPPPPKEEPKEREEAEAEEEEKKARSKTAEKTAEAEAKEPPAGIEDRIKETAELSEYLADQIEDLDGLMGRLTELPQQLEGVVSQALKRTLTARAKLDREAETALDDVLEALDEHVTQLAEVLQRFEHEEDHMRKMALEQVELSSRIESLQETFVDRIERIETQRRRGEEAIAVAIDRTARGLAPRALESLSKSTKRKVAPAPRKAKAKAKATERKTVAKKTTARKQPKPKPKRSKARRSSRLDWTPLPSDEAPR